MTDEMLLIGTIKSKGIKYYFLAECLKLSYQSLRNKITNKREFLPSEIEKICEVLGISDDLKLKNDIFFAKFVEEKSTKEELSNVTEGNTMREELLKSKFVQKLYNQIMSSKGKSEANKWLDMLVRTVKVEHA